MAACDSFTLATLIGEARYSTEHPLQIQLTGSANYPIAPDSPVNVLVRPDFATIEESLVTQAAADGTYLVYADDLRDLGLGTDEGYLINILYDGNGNFFDQYRADIEDIIGVYDSTQAQVLSVDQSQFTKVFPGTLASVVVDFPGVPADGDEPQNRAPDDTPTVMTAGSLAGRTLRRHRRSGLVPVH